jgi:hypothetical protein
MMPVKTPVRLGARTFIGCGASVPEIMSEDRGGLFHARSLFVALLACGAALSGSADRSIAIKLQSPANVYDPNTYKQQDISGIRTNGKVSTVRRSYISNRTR